MNLKTGRFEKATTVKEFAEFLGITSPTLYKRAKDGQLVLSKVGTRTVILPNHANAYLDSLEQVA